MAEWTQAAVGTSISNLQATIANVELKKGDKIKVIMECPWVTAHLFDLAGAELIFEPYVPEGIDLVDVYEENGYGVVEMEADPAFLAPLLAFIAANWVAIVIGGTLLAIAVTFIWVLIKVVQTIQALMPWILYGSIALFGYAVFKRVRSP